MHGRAPRRSEFPYASGRAIVRLMLVLIRKLSVPQMPFRPSRILLRRRDRYRRDALDGSYPAISCAGTPDRPRAIAISSAYRYGGADDESSITHLDRLPPEAARTTSIVSSIMTSRPCVRQRFLLPLIIPAASSVIENLKLIEEAVALQRDL